MLAKSIKENHCNHWIKSEQLTYGDRQCIEDGDWVHDNIILAAMNIIKRDHPYITIHAPSFIQQFGFSYCPHETLQIAHNGANHWVLLTSR